MFHDVIDKLMTTGHESSHVKKKTFESFKIQVAIAIFTLKEETIYTFKLYNYLRY